MGINGTKLTKAPRDSWCVGIYGGSFDPPHNGHVQAAAVAISSGEIDHLLVVPAYQHPFGKNSVPFDSRIEMCRFAFGPFGEKVQVIEAGKLAFLETNSGRTIDLLRYLDFRGWKGTSFRLVIGTDIVAQRGAWSAWDEVVARAPPLVLERGDCTPEDRALYGTVGPPIPNFSSTEARSLLTRNDYSEAAKIVPESVLEYIRAQNLYCGS